jgi:hypothetical protein
MMYSGVSLDRLQDVADALGLEIEERVTYAASAEPATQLMPARPLADLDAVLAEDPAYREALRALARREAIARKLIRLRLMLWRGK